MKDIQLTLQPLLVEIYGDIFKDKILKVYDKQAEPEKLSFTVKSKSDTDLAIQLRIENQEGSHVKFIDSNNETHLEITIPIKAKEDKTVDIIVHPGELNAEVEAKIIATADYSSQVWKKIITKTKKSPSPNIKFNFEFINDIYYIGEGEVLLGNLEIEANKTGDEPDYAYSPLDLSSLTSSCERIKIYSSQTKDDKMLYVGKEKKYNIYFSTDEKENVEFRFSIGDRKSSKYSVDVKNLKDPLVKNFTPRESLRFDELKDDRVIGYLSTDLKQEERGYFTRDNGMFELKDKNYSFDKDGKKYKQELELGENKYPIYVNINQLFGCDRDNIDTDIVSTINDFFYTDSSTSEEQIDAGYNVQHIPAPPLSNIHILNGPNFVTDINNPQNITLDEWRYDSVYSSQVISAVICTICLCNNQRLKYHRNGVLWQDIEISGDHIISQNFSCKEIINGEDEFKIPVRVEFANIRNESQITVNFKCKEIINDCDVDKTIEKEIEANIIIPISEIIVDDWYSIDLGTTGIVVAKWCSANQDGGNNGISTVNLADQGEQSIESSSNIVSSITILKQNSEDPQIADVVVAPSKTGLKQDAKFVLVPTKFMVGQNVLPFVEEYKSKFPNGVKLEDDKLDWNNLTPQDILKYTYKTIFKRISTDECNLIRKLIITYPNTYTPNSLDWLRTMILSSGIFANLTERNLHFIPESDSVVAFYVNKSMLRENNRPSERVVIYDMGAGTLDLSYVKITIEQEANRRLKKSIIDRRIGLPIAGEYFSYLIYDQYKDKIQDDIANYTIKTWVESFKAKFQSGNTTKLCDVSDGESVIKSSSINEVISLDEQTNKWINLCTEDALIQLLGSEWYNEVDRIVLSGRGSQFQPIRSKLKKLCNIHNIEFDIDTIRIEELKQCVAEGAILYQKIFENPSMPFTIIHKNSYERIGIKYRILDESFTKKWAYKELMNESHLIWDETPQDGAIFAHMPYREIRDLDFTLDEDVVFCLTTLSEEEMHDVILNPGTEKEAFIHELFRFKPRILTCAGDDRTHCMLSLSINSNNVLSVSIYSMDLLPHSTLPNVEDDKFYVKCNWYFN